MFLIFGFWFFKGGTMSKYIKACLLVIIVILTGCHKDSKTDAAAINKGENMAIQKGSSVSINYTLKVDNKVVDSSSGKDPLTYVQGSDQIIPGLEEQLEGLKKGDKKHLTVTPEKGYGVSDPRAVQKIPKKAFQDADKMKVGDVVNGKVNDQEFQAVISAITNADITIDLNHPLAGKTLNFDIEIMDVK